MKKLDFFSLAAYAAALIASFLAFAVSRNGEAYVSVSHMGGLAYLHPLLAVVGLVFGILALSRKLDGKYAAAAFGALVLGLSVFLVGQAQSQLDYVVRMHFKMQADREWFNKGLGEEIATREEAAMSGTQPKTVNRPAVVVPEEFSATYGLGFYLSMAAGGALLACGLLGIARGKAIPAAA